jgi:hypothetical protein
MFPKSPLVLRVVACTVLLGSIGASARAEESGQLRVRARIARQSYCRADADLFTVSLKLEIEVLNVSKEAVEVKRSMIPWVAKVAPNAVEAEAGHFMFEVTQSHYPRDAKPSDTVRIEPGKSVTLHTGYDFVARYNATFSYPKSISAGTYAIVLVLRPEIESPNQNKNAHVIETLTTEPFFLEVRKNPKVVNCASTGPARKTRWA